MVQIIGIVILVVATTLSITIQHCLRIDLHRLLAVTSSLQAKLSFLALASAIFLAKK